MNFRDRLCLNVSPLLIRLSLALVFLWAGSSKLFYSDPVLGEDAAILANLGVIEAKAPDAAAPPAPATTTPPAETTTPAEPATPAETPASPAADTPDSNGGVTFTLPKGQEPAATASALRVFTAAQFTDPVQVARRHQITLQLYKKAQPDANGRQLWPSALASPLALKSLAWIAVLTEFVGGFLMLVGFLSRLSALGLAVNMMVAMLLTTIGPAVLDGKAFLGFLPQPNLGTLAGSGDWMPLILQFTMLMAALAIALGGPGALSLDRLIFGGRGALAQDASDSDEDDDD